MNPPPARRAVVARARRCGRPVGAPDHEVGPPAHTSPALILVNGPVIGPEHIQFELVNEVSVPSDTGTFRTFTPMSGMPQRQPAHVSAQSAANADSWLARAYASSQLPTPADASLARTLGNAEKELLLEALRSGSPRREVAERLGISPRTLRHKLARLREAGVEVPAA